MEYIATDGLVVSVRDCGENDRLISMLTPERGRLRVLVKGGRSLRGGQGTVTQLFTYGNYELTMKNGFYSFRSGVADRVFFPYRVPIQQSALMYYLAEIACEITDENEPADEVMRMLLNALYLLHKKKDDKTDENDKDDTHDRYNLRLLKATFELRAAVLAGYEPEIEDHCACCGKRAEIYFLDVDNGRVLCPDCVARLGQNVPILSEDDRRVQNSFCRMSAATLSAVQYACLAPQKRLYAFALPQAEDVSDFSHLAETYLLHHLDRRFQTLDFYKTFVLH